LGTLTQFLGLRKVNTIGIQQANKVMHLSAIAYNLKKYLKLVEKRVKSGAKALMPLFTSIKALIRDILKPYNSPFFIPRTLN
jgi:hypothetical protein